MSGIGRLSRRPSFPGAAGNDADGKEECCLDLEEKVRFEGPDPGNQALPIEHPELMTEGDGVLRKTCRATRPTRGLRARRSSAVFGREAPREVPEPLLGERAVLGRKLPVERSVDITIHPARRRGGRPKGLHDVRDGDQLDVRQPFERLLDLLANRHDIRKIADTKNSMLCPCVAARA